MGQMCSGGWPGLLICPGWQKLEFQEKSPIFKILTPNLIKVLCMSAAHTCSSCWARTPPSSASAALASTMLCLDCEVLHVKYQPSIWKCSWILSSDFLLSSCCRRMQKEEVNHPFQGPKPLFPAPVPTAPSSFSASSLLGLMSPWPEFLWGSVDTTAGCVLHIYS